MKFVLVRHVETQGNVAHRFNGFTESEYTAHGLSMKAQLVDALIKQHEKEPFELVLASPTLRALHIGEEFSKATGVPLITNPALMEFNFGIFDGLTPKEAEEKNSEAYFRWMNDHLNVEIPEGDSYRGKYAQTAAYVHTLTTAYKDKKLLIISHGAVLRCMITAFLDMPLEAGWHLDMALGAICEIEYEDDYGILKKLTSPDYQGENIAGYHKRFKH